MGKENFEIDIRTIWALVIGYLVLIILGTVGKVQHWEFGQYFLSMGFAVFCTSWLLILSDMIKNRIYNKVFWIATMFIIPGISSIFYLVQRERLLRLGEKF